jgi:hypothetical protein
MSYDCVNDAKTLGEVVGMMRTVLLVSVCLASGEDETMHDDD